MDKEDFRKILKEEAEFQDEKITAGKRAEFYIFYKDNKEIYNFFKKAIRSEGGRLLVLGCGDEKIEDFLKNGFDEVLGIDISKKSIEKIRERIVSEDLGKKVKVLLMDAHNLEFKDDTFDFVIGEAILHHLNLKKAIPQIYRVLKKEGRIVFLEPQGMNPLINWYRKKTKWARTKYEHPLKIKDYKLMKKYFDIKIKGFYFLTILSFGFKVFLKSDFLYKISRMFFSKLDSCLLFIFPFLKYLCWLAVIEGKKYAKK
jgi:ubiquinone/menaquinone biosynthesis C-methylase UbiE